MYRELAEFLGHIAFQKSIWKDGELWTAVAGGVACTVWFYYDPAVIEGIREHLADLLSVASIVFGFVMTTLVFYAQAASTWSKNPRVRKVAEKIVDWHVWTIVCLLGLIAYILFLWLAGGYLGSATIRQAVAFGFLAFLALYCCLQIVNHALIVRWVFRRSSDLEKP